MLFLTFQTAQPLAPGTFGPLLEQASSSFCAVLDFLTLLHPELKTAQTVSSHRGSRLRSLFHLGRPHSQSANMAAWIMTHIREELEVGLVHHWGDFGQWALVRHSEAALCFRAQLLPTRPAIASCFLFAV